MARTESSMLPLGTIAPSFALKDVCTNHICTLEHCQGKVGTIIAFICNHCPYVKHINQALPRLAQEFAQQGVSFIAISSNDISQYPDDSPEAMQITAQTLGYNFPYLYDETQEVALAYQARCTPDFFVFDHDLTLVYRGQFDDARPHNTIPVTGESIRAAVHSLIKHEPISTMQKPSLGCNIKWKEDRIPA